VKKQPAIGRKLFSVGEAFVIVYRAMRSMPAFARARKNGLVSEHFMERLMLAVTEVNKCAMCSYAHTKMALESGMDKEEIDAMLAGDLSGVSDEERTAVLFAQHYADTRGRPDRGAWDAVVKAYGLPKSLGILGAVRAIMMGNAYGIPSGNLLMRFKRNGKRDNRSSLPYELAMLLTLPVFLPVAALAALLAGALRAPILRF